MEGHRPGISLFESVLYLINILGNKERAMKVSRPNNSSFEPALYRISILGSLDVNWSDYCGGMTIEHECDPKRYTMTTLTGRLVDQSALLGVLNSLHDIGYPIISVECVEAV